jgi:O-antigen ligase
MQHAGSDALLWLFGAGLVGLLLLGIVLIWWGR